MPEASMECIREVDSVLTEVPPIYWFPGLLLASLLVIQIRLAYDFPIHDVNKKQVKFCFNSLFFLKKNRIY